MRGSSQIALVTPLWDPAKGGREAYLAELVQKLHRLGTGTHVFCLRAAGSGECPPAGVTLARRMGVLLRQVAAWAPDDGPRRVLSAGPFPGATHYQLHSGLQARAFEAERESLDSDLRRLLYWPALAWNRRRAALIRFEEAALAAPGSRVMVWSESLRSEVARRYGLPPDRIVVEHPGLDLSLFRARRRGGDPRGRNGQLALLFVANNFPLKGLRWALEALASVRRRGVGARLRVVGAGSVRPFRALAGRLGVEEQVEFLGRVPRSGLPGLYANSDALLHPTFYDPFSLATLEALGCGCPVITTRRNGISELIDSGGGGFVVDQPQEVDAMAGAIEALHDPWVSDRKRVEASRIAQQFPIERHTRAVATWLGGARE